MGQMEEEISLLEIGQILIKRWKLLFILPLLAAAIAFVASAYLITPQYVSTSTLIVMPFTETVEGSGVVRHDVASTRQVVQSCKELTLRTTSLQEIIGELRLPYSAGELRDQVSIDVGDVISVSATDSDPDRAQLIANTVTAKLMSYITDTARLENVQLLNPAQRPGSPDSPRVMLNMAVAYVLGIMISVALAFLFEHLDNTVKTAEDVQKFLGVPVLGVIPEFEEEGGR